MNSPAVAELSVVAECMGRGGGVLEPTALSVSPGVSSPWLGGGGESSSPGTECVAVDSLVSEWMCRGRNRGCGLLPAVYPEMTGDEE